MVFPHSYLADIGKHKIMNQQSKQQPLVLPRNNYDDKDPFEGDLLEREKLAIQLTSYIKRLRVGAVLAIDAPWGEGKTWFGNHWAKYLQRAPNNHKVIYIDAFAQDYIEDPFLLITAEIAGKLKASDSKTSQAITEKATDVMKAFLPISSKLLLNMVGQIALGSTDLANEIKGAMKTVNDEMANAASDLIKKKLEDYSSEKETLKSFKEILMEFCRKEPEPVVIFIDELDRCRPTFAVQLIERIKHLFDVPNLVFVLLLNREQLENAIKGIYGNETDAAKYLGKFINLFFRLPKKKNLKNINLNNNQTKKFITDVIKRYEFEQEIMMGNSRDLVCTTPSNNFVNDLTVWAIVEDLSLREIEHACALFVMSNTQHTGLIAYLIALKIKHPTLYKELTENKRSGHKKARNNLSDLIQNNSPDDREFPYKYFKALDELHALQLCEIKMESADNLRQLGGDFFGSTSFSKLHTFSNAFNLIDLPVETY